jgi:formylglycine-generating enzyme required for sulfatase activity
MKPKDKIRPADLIKKTQDMNRVDMTPAEMVEKFQKAYPHIEVRLSKPGDPELSSVFINFYPELMKSKPDTPLENSGNSSEFSKEQLEMHNQYLKSMKTLFQEKEYTCPILSAKFVLIPAGTFMMGSPEDDPERLVYETLHQVTISKPFYMQTMPVTQGQWQKVMGNNPSHFKGDDNCPVENVSWNDVQEFISKLNSMEREDRYRLPTEAEWEYACRTGSTTAYCFGDDPGHLGEYAWYSSNSGSKTHPVGQKTPNAWGLYDMHGNVWEWVQDRCGDYLSGNVTDPEGLSSGWGRVIRGGSWGSDARLCRSAYFSGDDPESRSLIHGFRLLRTME